MVSVKYRQILFEAEGLRILVDLWPGEPAQLSIKAHPGGIWSNPVDATWDQERERII